MSGWLSWLNAVIPALQLLALALALGELRRIRTALQDIHETLDSRLPDSYDAEDDYEDDDA
jgi:hypothetical protein